MIQLSDLDTIVKMPKIMGVLNVTPDSFHAGSRVQSVDAAVRSAEAMVAAGATILDIGGEATNPQLDVTVSQVSVDEECNRVIPVVEKLRAHVDVDISVDTSKPEVMKAAVAAGATMINDQRALLRPGALEAAAQLAVPVCLMHMYGLHLREPNSQPYQNTLDEVKSFLQKRAEACVAMGIAPDSIIIDPGFGHGNYGKSTEENLYLINHIDQFVELGFSVMLGVSRKTTIGDVLQVPAAERLSGSLGLHVLAALRGVNIIRAHDVLETVQAVRMALSALAIR